MKRLLYTLCLILASLIQITWAPFLTIGGFPLPLVLLLLLVSTLFYQVTVVLIFAFGIGIFINLLTGGMVGSYSLSLICALTAASFVRSLFLGRKGFGFLLGAVFALIIYEIWFFLF